MRMRIKSEMKTRIALKTKADNESERKGNKNKNQDSIHHLRPLLPLASARRSCEPTGVGIPIPIARLDCQGASGECELRDESGDASARAQAKLSTASCLFFAGAPSPRPLASSLDCNRNSNANSSAAEKLTCAPARPPAYRRPSRLGVARPLAQSAGHSALANWRRRRRPLHLGRDLPARVAALENQQAGGR